MTESRRRANRKYYALHRTERNAESSRRYHLHRQERSEQYKAYYAAHREEVSAQKKARYNAHKTDIRAARRKKPYEDVLAVIVNAPQRLKNNAHEAIRDAVGKGFLIESYSCERCGTIGRLNAHHVNYTKPLDVIWLCSKCHNTVHGNMRRCGQ